MLDTKLLPFTCRHHVNEIIISDVFNTCHGGSSGPDILLFSRFRKFWTQINKANYEPDDTAQPWKSNVLSFCLNQLKMIHNREDYRELLELTVFYLGGCPETGISF
jgi:hypothetical protein